MPANNKRTHHSAKRRGSVPHYKRLTQRQKATRESALNLLSELRRGEGSYSELLRKHRLDTRTAHKYLGRALLGGPGKPVRASKADRLAREVWFPTSLGDVQIVIRSSRAATKLSEFFGDRAMLLDDKLSAHDFEAKWRGVRVAGRELFADASEIFRMENAGIFQFESLYASTSGAR